MLSAALLMLSGSILTATVAYWYQRAIWAKRAALDFALTYEIHDQEWVKSRGEAIRFLESLPRDRCEGLAKRWSDKTLTQSEIAKLTDVFVWLNHMEMVAIGVLNRSLHESSYLNWFGHDDLPRRWSTASPLVDELRKTSRGGSDLYENFEKLAVKVKRQQAR